MEICKSKASITVQMFCESLKIAGRAAVALPQCQCPGKTRSQAPFMKDIHSLLEEGFRESLSFPHNFMQYLKERNVKMNIRIQS